MPRLRPIIPCCMLLLTTVGCGGGGTQSIGPSANAADISGKWEFANGMNVNLTQNQSQVSGTSVLQRTSTNTPPTDTLVLQACNPDTVTGTARDSSVSLQSGDCGAMTATVDATGAALNGGAWGDGFKVASVAGQYSGTITFFDANGNVMGTPNATLALTEDPAFNVTGTLTVGAGNPVQLTGRAVGGVINLGNGALVGRVQKAGGIQLTVSPTATFFCTLTGCDTVGNGVVR